MRFLVKVASKVGIDGAIAYSSISQVVAGVTGVFSVFFITTFLTGVEQGFYYTFGSILALQVFFELGLTGIMTQFVAHEASHLKLKDNLEYEGDYTYKSRLASLVHFCVRWYMVLAIIVFVFLLIAGFVYFDRFGSEHEEVSWRIPWGLICMGTSIKLFQSPFNSILMGLGKVKEMTKIGFWQQMVLPSISWIGLVVGFKLYIVGISYFSSVILWQLFVHKTGLEKIIINLWEVKVTERVMYVKEIFPYQWKIALSWISGYFIFQLFNPVLFATEGAVVAGQMGMTLTALNAIQGFSRSWLNTKVPLYSTLIARKDYFSLDHVFQKTLFQMTSICATLLFIFIFVMWILNNTKFRFNGSILAERFLYGVPLLLLSISVLLQQFVSSWATYLRCHKKEPFLLYSILSGIACCLSTFVLGNLYGLNGITIGYFIISIVFFPFAYLIYKTKRKEWHNG